jgi:hypothetical protein
MLIRYVQDKPDTPTSPTPRHAVAAESAVTAQYPPDTGDDRGADMRTPPRPLESHPRLHGISSPLLRSCPRPCAGPDGAAADQ